MSTFPTAFWKGQPSTTVAELSINWATGLAWSHGNDWVSEYQANDPEFTVKDFSSFPFWKQDPYQEYKSYYTAYDSTLGPAGGGLPYFPEAYYAWFLTGGYETPYNSSELNDLTSIHRANPFALKDNGTGLHFYYETDYETVVELEYYQAPENPTPIADIDKTYNRFIQSGNATGTFTLSTSATFYIKMSGLGEDNALGSTDHDTVYIKIDNVGKVSGHAPKDGREQYFGAYSALDLFQHQTKFFNWGSNTVQNAGLGFCKEDHWYGNPLPNYTTETSCTNNGGEWVTSVDDVEVGRKAGGADKFSPVTTTQGQWTYSQALSAGSHTVEISFSSNDGLYHSGAYCGFDFWTG